MVRPSLTSLIPWRGRQVKAAVQTLPARQRNLRSPVRRAWFSPWQSRAGDMADSPEAGEALSWMGNAVSKVRLYCAYQSNPDAEPVPLFEAAEPPDGQPAPPGVSLVLAELAQSTLDMVQGPIGQRPQIQAMMAKNLCSTGAGYLWASADSREWTNLSVEQVRNVLGSDTYQIILTPVATAGAWIDLPEGDILYRYWNPHFRYSTMADSPLRHVLDAWEERNRIDDAYKAVEQSRIAQAGLLLLDSRARFPDQGDAQQGDSDPASNDTLSKIAEAGMTAIGQPDSASAALPVMLELDMGDSLDRRIQDYAYHLTFDRNMSEQDAQRWATLTTQIIQGLPCPPEIITGLGASSTYANARLVTQEAYSAYVAPVVTLICDAFTRGWIQPALIDAGVPREVAEKVVVWADPDTIISQPDRAKYAMELLKEGAISDASARAATGFDEGDAPDEEEMARRDARNRPQIGTPGSEDNPNGQDNLAASLPVLELAPIEAVVVASANPDRVARLGDRLATIDAELNAWLLEAITATMDTALNRAGARLRQKAQGTKANKEATSGVPLDRIFATLGPRAVRLASEQELLDGAFDDLRSRYLPRVERAQARALAAASSVDRDAYTARQRAAISEQQAEDRDRSWSWLSAALTALAIRRLHDPSDLGFDPRGEVDTTAGVPFGYVRGAVQIAGGMAGEPGNPSGDMTPQGTIPAGGVATGETITSSLDAVAGVQVAEDVWVWGDADRPFEPHQRLDGQPFTSPEDPVLAADTDWPPVEFYSVGDHDGCSCAAVPMFVTEDNPDEPEGLG